jgi:hypothetical protein
VDLKLQTEAGTLACMTPVTGTLGGTARRSPRFVAWVRAWRAGFIPYDDVVDEVGYTEDHLVADAGTEEPEELPLREGLARLSSLHPDQIRLVLPVPGDPRGLPGPSNPFTGEALVAGEGVVAGPLGLVPAVRTHISGSGDSFSTVVWRLHELPAPVLPHQEATAAEAEAELTGALSEATAALTDLDVAQWRPELAGALAALRRHDDGSELPPVFNPRARRLYARASRLDRVLALASLAAPGGATSASEAEARDAALRPLIAACRRALVAACNAPLA